MSLVVIQREKHLLVSVITVERFPCRVVEVLRSPELPHQVDGRIVLFGILLPFRFYDEFGKVIACGRKTETQGIGVTGSCGDAQVFISVRRYLKCGPIRYGDSEAALFISNHTLLAADSIDVHVRKTFSGHRIGDKPYISMDLLPLRTCCGHSHKNENGHCYKRKAGRMPAHADP